MKNDNRCKVLTEHGVLHEYKQQNWNLAGQSLTLLTDVEQLFLAQACQYCEHKRLILDPLLQTDNSVLLCYTLQTRKSHFKHRDGISLQARCALCSRSCNILPNHGRCHFRSRVDLTVAVFFFSNSHAKNECTKSLVCVCVCGGGGYCLRKGGLVNWNFQILGLVNHENFQIWGLVNSKRPEFGSLRAKILAKIWVEAKISHFSQKGVLWTD